MSITELVLLILIGFAAGAFSGLFGIGGGLIMVPALVLFLGMSQHAAQGTSLGVLVIPVAFVAAYNYYRQGQLNVYYALVIAISFVIGGYFGSKLSLGINEVLLKRLFGVLMMILALRLIFFTKSAA
ncbi:MAG: sulfite exporter TauE/SafE family protein [Salibacteraceae bacterium]